MMNKSIAATIASVIAYGCMLETTNGAMLRQADAGDHLEPFKGTGLAQTAEGDHLEPYKGTGLAQTTAEQALKSIDSNTPVSVEFDNETNQTVELFWLDFHGKEVPYGKIAAGESKFMNTYATHPWIAKGINNGAIRINVDGEQVYVPEKEDNKRIIHIDEEYASYTWNQPVFVTFKNESQQKVELFWHNYQGNLVSYGQIAAGGSMPMNTYATHPWSAVGVDDNGQFMSVDNEPVFVPVAGDANRQIVIEPIESKTWTGGLLNLTFDNESGQDVDLYWHNYNGDEVYYGRIAAGKTFKQQTYATHPWSVKGVNDPSKHLVVDGDDVFVPDAADQNSTIYIGQED